MYIRFINTKIMATLKKQTAFRFDSELLQDLEIKAKAENRSLNNYIEYVLLTHVGKIPNNETKKAIENANNNIGMTAIGSLKAYKESF